MAEQVNRAREEGTRGGELDLIPTLKIIILKKHYGINSIVLYELHHGTRRYSDQGGLLPYIVASLLTKQVSK